MNDAAEYINSMQQGIELPGIRTRRPTVKPVEASFLDNLFKSLPIILSIVSIGVCVYLHQIIVNKQAVNNENILLFINEQLKVNDQLKMACDKMAKRLLILDNNQSRKEEPEDVPQPEEVDETPHCEEKSSDKQSTFSDGESHGSEPEKKKKRTPVKKNISEPSN